MDKPGIDELACRKVFGSLGAAIAGTRLASVPEAVLESLQLLARGAGESGVAIRISEHNDARGMHPRIDSIHYAAAEFPEMDMQAALEGRGLTITCGCRTPVPEVINLFFELDVERLPFEEAAQITAAKRLAAAAKVPPRKTPARRR